MEVLEKKNALFNIINHDPDIDQFFLYAKDPHEAKYQFLVNKRQSEDLNDLKTFIEYSNNIDDICEDIEEYNSNKKQKILIIFDDLIFDMLSNKKINPIVTELFIRGRTLHNLWTFIKNVLQNHILFLIIFTTLALDNSSCFMKNLLERT